MSTPRIYLALLRGINVGGNNKISMADLRTVCEQAGFTNVQTFGNSGNVVFTATTKDPRTVEADLMQALQQKLRATITVLAFSLKEIASIVKVIPTNWNKPGRKYDIIFLHHSIDKPSIVEQLHPNPDLEELFYHPGAIFWSVATKDFGKSYVPKIVGTELYKLMTIRTPGVVRKLWAMMEKLPN